MLVTKGNKMFLVESPRLLSTNEQQMSERSERPLHFLINFTSLLFNIY